MRASRLGGCGQDHSIWNDLWVVCVQSQCQYENGKRTDIHRAGGDDNQRRGQMSGNCQSKAAVRIPSEICHNLILKGK